MTMLRELQSGDHALIGDIIAEGFADDPVNLWAFRNPAVMKPVYTIMARDLYLRTGFGHCCGDRAGTLWLPPNVKKQFGLRGMAGIARNILLKGGPLAVRNGLLIDNMMLKKKPREPHYYLFAIAARPGEKGKGLGGTLMREALKRIDAESQPAYLENSKPENIGFYRHFGFEIVEEARAHADAPPLFLMWRPAR